MDWECGCAKCNTCDDPFAGEHEADCCCEDCHEERHNLTSGWEAICELCEDILAREQKEKVNGND